ncbi:hypothetical protein U1Q18_044791 [Sarracenia purpurea var. burkii]
MLGQAGPLERESEKRTFGEEHKGDRSGCHQSESVPWSEDSSMMSTHSEAPVGTGLMTISIVFEAVLLTCRRRRAELENSLHHRVFYNSTRVERHNGKIALRDLSRWLASRWSLAHVMGHAGRFLKHSAQRYQSQNRLPARAGKTQENSKEWKALRSSPPERLHKTRRSNEMQLNIITLPMYQPALIPLRQQVLPPFKVHSKTRATSGMAGRSSDRKTTCCRASCEYTRSGLIYTYADSLLLTTIVKLAIAICAPQHSPEVHKRSLNCALWHATYKTASARISTKLQRGLCQAIAFVNMPLRSSERLQLYCKLGSGGFGQVHCAYFRGSILAEVDEASPHHRVDRLQHTSGHAAGTAVLPYCSGGSLRIEDTASDRSNSLKKRMIAQLMSALHYCHAPLHGGMSILHRDIKPENGEECRMP